MLPVRPVSLTRVHHTLGVAQLGLEAVRAGLTVVADREMQQQRATVIRQKLSTPATAPWLTSAYGGGVPTTHVPDSVVSGPTVSATAIEVELSRKNNEDLRRVLLMYGRSQKYYDVVSLTPERAMAARPLLISG